MKHLLWIEGRWEEGQGGEPARLHSPFNQKETGTVALASRSQVERMIGASACAFFGLRKISRYTRSRLLSAIAKGISERRQEFIDSMVLEAGKPYGLADGEVSRALVTFTCAAEEAKRWGGELLPIDLDPAGRAYAPAVVQWFPRGPILAIAPFNFPLNLIAHKVAPALACGASVMVKPPPQAPGAARLLAEVFEKAAKEASDSSEQIPAAALQVFSCSNELTSLAVTDPRIATVSFTGSERVGWLIQEKAIHKRVILELGGNAGVIIHADADLARAAARCAFGGFAYAGQVCISVQRIFVHEEVAERFQELLVRETAKLGCGDPSQKDTVIGPMIDRAAADRVMTWITEAKDAGAQVLTGGTREGNVISPTILSGVKRELKVSCEEVFGPVVVLATYREFDDAIACVNDSPYGLQAGVFTENTRLIQKAFSGLEVGGVMINEVPTFRADNMPYGGVKHSGLGREGIRYAMEQYCERRALVQWLGFTR